MSETHKDRHIVHECVHKLVQIIVQSRVRFSAPQHVEGNRYFNLDYPELKDIRKQVDQTMQLDQGIHSRLQLEVSLRAASLPRNVLLERWELQFEPTGYDAPLRRIDPAALYKKLIMLVRGVMAQTRLLPAHQLFKASQASFVVPMEEEKDGAFGIFYTVTTANQNGTPASFERDAENYVFDRIESSWGILHVHVFYRRDCNFEFARTKPAGIHNHIISDYMNRVPQQKLGPRPPPGPAPRRESVAAQPPVARQPSGFSNPSGALDSGELLVPPSSSFEARQRGFYYEQTQSGYLNTLQAQHAPPPTPYMSSGTLGPERSPPKAIPEQMLPQPASGPVLGTSPGKQLRDSPHQFTPSSHQSSSKSSTYLTGAPSDPVLSQPMLQEDSDVSPRPSGPSLPVAPNRLPPSWTAQKQPLRNSPQMGPVPSHTSPTLMAQPAIPIGSSPSGLPLDRPMLRRNSSDLSDNLDRLGTSAPTGRFSQRPHNAFSPPGEEVPYSAGAPGTEASPVAPGSVPIGIPRERTRISSSPYSHTPPPFAQSVPRNMSASSMNLPPANTFSPPIAFNSRHNSFDEATHHSPVVVKLTVSPFRDPDRVSTPGSTHSTSASNLDFSDKSQRPPSRPGSATPGESKRSLPSFPPVPTYSSSHPLPYVEEEPDFAAPLLDDEDGGDKETVLGAFIKRMQQAPPLNMFLDRDRSEELSNRSRSASSSDVKVMSGLRLKSEMDRLVSVNAEFAALRAVPPKEGAGAVDQR